MKIIQQNIWVIILITIGLQFLACKPKPRIYEYIEPAHIEHIDGSELSHLTLTPKAVERTGIETVAVREGNAPGSAVTQLIVPHSALIYDAHGHIWVYTNPEPLHYLRHEVKVDFIKDHQVYLHEGPPVGTIVVTVGAAELYGTEYEVGH